MVSRECTTTLLTLVFAIKYLVHRRILKILKDSGLMLKDTVLRNTVFYHPTLQDCLPQLRMMGNVTLICLQGTEIHTLEGSSLLKVGQGNQDRQEMSPRLRASGLMLKDTVHMAMVPYHLMLQACHLVFRMMANGTHVCLRITEIHLMEELGNSTITVSV
jgi:hypothetical protein